MRTLGSLLAETYASWLRSVSSCCGYDEKPRQSTEKSIVVLREQPSFIPPPIAAPLWSNERTYDGTLEQESGRLGRRSSSRGSGSTRKLWLSRSVSRRPQISGPSDFRHIQSESFQFPGPVHQQPAPFRPLELSIYLPDNRLSPLLPGLDDEEGRITTPPPVHYAAGSKQWDSSNGTLTNDRSYSSMSFHIPRKHLREGSNVSSSNTVTPPRIPPKSRARAYTSPSPSPSPDRLIERIASAMIEKERLQAEIDSVVERQSIYVNSRPSTGHGLKGEELDDINNNSLFNQNPWLMGATDLEPMPSIPALPAAAPSFAERVDNRPRTAPATRTGVSNLHTNTNMPMPVPQPMTPQETTLALAAAAFSSHPPTTPLSYTRVRIENSPTKEFKDDALFDRPLAPPLPLVLRPPLRKKKSFSRVSSWLFPGTEDHKRGMSLDSVTNLPRPVKESDGFYQCISPPSATTPTAPGGGMFEHHHREREGDHSEDTVSSVSTWETEEEDDEGQTVPTTWSPGSSPVIRNSPKHTPVIERRATFGKGNGGAGFRPQSVGVAM
ncbi:hypothetical protein B0T22DRAFT_478631 [Podospora appendiculata]|uniref:Uncharacterized protein n=1 Tax=Podospora appendiculata TaxID=314037 RepID=A0AAE0X7J3_9PEZI|nr:hypothetical protein B0T22DRAFT_478631 [Podospora appendiculata]